MTSRSVLHDLLDDTARDAARPVRDADAVCASAVRHRNQRRGLAAAATAVVAVTIAVGVAIVRGLPDATSLAPIAPPTSTVPTPEPTSTTAPTETTPPPETTPGTMTTAASPPPLTEAEARAALEDFRFPDEDEWHANEEAPHYLVETETEVTAWHAAGCAYGSVPATTALAMRTVTNAGPDATRQVAVFSDAESAGEAFTRLRTAMRGCQAETEGDATAGGPADARHHVRG
jgi:hypothetical protein